jgi:hypothetical protein
MMPYPNEHAARITDPDQYDEFSRKNIAPGLDIVLGIKDGESETQAYRFAKDKFTAAEARKWLKEHDIDFIKFEKATGKEASFDDSNKRALAYTMQAEPKNYVEQEDGSLLVKNSILLTAGIYTDSALRTPLNYPADTLRKYAGAWKANGLWVRHAGGVPRRITEKVGKVVRTWFEPSVEVTDDQGRKMTVPAIMGDLEFSRDNDESRNAAEMALNGAVKGDPLKLSVEHVSKERYNRETKLAEAEDLLFLGLALVDKGACSHSTMPKGLEQPTTEDNIMDKTEIEKMLAESKADNEKKMAELGANIRADITAALDVKVKELSESIAKVGKELSDNPKVKELADAVEKLKNTPAPQAHAEQRELALTLPQTGFRYKNGVVSQE